MKFKELEEGKIYLSKKGYRVARKGKYLYVLCTGNFVFEDNEKDGFREYPYPFFLPKQDLLDEEFVKGPVAVEEQIRDGRAEKRILCKTERGVRGYIMRKFEAYKKRMIKEKALLFGKENLNNERKGGVEV